jgi:predicted membrane metal-binding protein
MTIIAGRFAGSFGRLLGPRKGALAAIVGISAYTILVVANVAVVRAAVVWGVRRARSFGVWKSDRAGQRLAAGGQRLCPLQPS